MDALSARPHAWLRRALLVSVAGHVAVVGALLFLIHRSPAQPKVETRRGEPMIVELTELKEPAPPAPAISPAPVPGAPSRREPPPRPAPPAPVAKPVPAPPAPVAKPVSAPPATKPAPAEPPQAEPPRVAAPAPPTPPEPTPEPVAKAPEPAPSAPSAPSPDPHPAPPEPPRVAAVPKESAPGAPGRPVPDLKSLGKGGGVSGRGWGGIEGEPIGLDSSDPRYNDYLDRVRRLIKANWGYPCVRDPATRECEYKSVTLVVAFGILKDGRLQIVEVRRSSGISVYDDYAVNAIKLASPFPEVPPAMMQRGSSGVPILATFNYVVESSLTNILR